MGRRVAAYLGLIWSLTILFAAHLHAQVQPTSRLIPFAGAMPGQPDGPVALRFRFFPASSGGSFCFEEAQVVTVAEQAFTAFIGEGSIGGIPPSPCFTDHSS